MIVNIADHGGTIIWDNVYYFCLSDYPNISGWELRKLISFFDYERRHGREPKVTCEDPEIMRAVNDALANPARFLSAKRPGFITECTACRQKGCITDYLCHTASVQDAKSIFGCGKILSAVRARGQTGAELAKEPRNAANDPPDYFDCIMMAWGNCQAGDRLVMERMFRRFPDEHDLGAGLMPGVRFYFKTEAIENHANYVFDGYHPAKVKDELSLAEYMHCCIVPEKHRGAFKGSIPAELLDRVFYLDNDGQDIWAWSEKVYDFVCGREVG